MAGTVPGRYKLPPVLLMKKNCNKRKYEAVKVEEVFI
jgi:hypothetical protein